MHFCGKTSTISLLTLYKINRHRNCTKRMSRHGYNSLPSVAKRLNFVSAVISMFLFFLHSVFSRRRDATSAKGATVFSSNCQVSYSIQLPLHFIQMKFKSRTRCTITSIWVESICVCVCVFSCM